MEFANPKSRVVGSLWWARGTCATDRADGVSRVDVCLSRAARSSVIVFVVDEIVTEGNCPGCRRHDAKCTLMLAHKPS